MSVEKKKWVIWEDGAFYETVDMPLDWDERQVYNELVRRGYSPDIEVSEEY